jgi:TatD DNase family protein
MNSYKIVDTHSHLCDPIFDSDRTEVIERARDAGVSAIFTVGENLSDAKLNIELAKKYPELMPAAGLYPSCLDINQAEALASFIRREKNNLIAIGEVGLDFWIVKNEPSNVAISVDAIAEIKNIRREEVIETVFENTCRLYGKLL